MKIILITLSNIMNLESHSIYTDLIKIIKDNNHEIYVVSPAERRNGIKTQIISYDNCHILKVRTGNIQKTNLIEKGISTVFLETQLISAIKKYLKNIKFDLVLYSTPPVTISGVVKYLKNRDKAITYLMLKDIFPQNAVDYKMMKKSSIIYKYFRKKEKQLYYLSDYIGCTSSANIDYIAKNNSEISKNKLELCVNSMEPHGDIFNKSEIIFTRKKYSLPINKRIFLYGGNLGKPQGVDFIMECLERTSKLDNAYFLMIVNGTEVKRFTKFLEEKQYTNVKLLSYLDEKSFDEITHSCDVGMIFLDKNTTTPNTPARLLSYTNAGIPVLAVTDNATDVGDIVVRGNFGWKCYSNDVEKYYNLILRILDEKNLDEYKMNSRSYFLNNYTTKHTYNQIFRHFDCCGRKNK